jgi:hypothetical protein
LGPYSRHIGAARLVLARHFEYGGENPRGSASLHLRSAMVPEAKMH